MATYHLTIKGTFNLSWEGTFVLKVELEGPTPPPSLPAKVQGARGGPRRPRPRVQGGWGKVTVDLAKVTFKLGGVSKSGDSTSTCLAMTM